tara:strand:+ start:161 stop:424 length:264 start_codon:yes stop_codon:yes gene_type:complete
VANIFWTGKKEPKDKVIKALREKAVDSWENAFHVRFKEKILELIVEMEDTNEKTGLWKVFPDAKFMGHEIHILKVPIGQIAVFYKDK